MAATQYLSSDIAGAFLPCLQDVVQRMHGPLGTPQCEQWAIYLELEISSIMLKVDTCGGAVVFAKSVQRTRLMKASQILLICFFFHPPRRVSPQSPSEPCFEAICNQ